MGIVEGTKFKRLSSPGIGAEGYCPDDLKRENKWLKSQKTYLSDTRMIMSLM